MSSVQESWCFYLTVRNPLLHKGIIIPIYAYEETDSQKAGKTLCTVQQKGMQPWLGTQAGFSVLVWILCCSTMPPERLSDFVQSFDLIRAVLIIHPKSLLSDSQNTQREW